MTGLRWHAAQLTLDSSVRVLRRCEVEKVETADAVLARAREALEAAEASMADVLKRARQAGWQEGFSAGTHEGLCAGREAWAKELIQRRLDNAHVLRSIQDDVTSLVMSCLKSLLGELEDAERFLRLTARVLDLASQSRRVRLHVSPSRCGPMLALVSPGSKAQFQSEIEVLEDPTLGPDDCLLETESGVVDGRLLVRLQCIEDLLVQRLAALERGP